MGLCLYGLRVVVRDPSDETEGRYLAEIPDLPSCRAWGDSSAQALESLKGVASAFIASYQDRKDPLPSKIAAAIVNASQHRGLPIRIRGGSISDTVIEDRR